MSKQPSEVLTIEVPPKGLSAEQLQHYHDPKTGVYSRKLDNGCAHEFEPGPGGLYVHCTKCEEIAPLRYLVINKIRFKGCEKFPGYEEKSND